MASPAFDSIRRLTAEETLRMVEAGIVGEDEPVELLEGVLVQTSPQGPLHSESTTNLADALRKAYEGLARVREEKPLAAGTYSLPEPDIAVVRGTVGTYAERHPSGRDAILVVELAWSSQAQDRDKAPIYAAAGVPVYWLVDLAARTVSVHRDPGEGAYRVVEEHGEDGSLVLPELDVSWPVRSVLG